MQTNNEINETNNETNNKVVTKLFREHGFYTPIHVTTEEQVQRHFAEYLNYAQLYGENGILKGDARFRVHLLARWAYDIVTHPALVEVVKSVLGTDDVLCWSSDLNIKQPNSQGFFSWHQDSTYSGLHPDDDVLTAWVALSPSNADSGALCFIPDTHRVQLDHIEIPSENNLLSLGQTIKDSSFIREECTVRADLRPGQCSLHHWKCVHASGKNNSDRQRVGLAIRYMKTSVKMTKGVETERATLVSGVDQYGHFELEGPPQVDYGAEEWRQHRLSMDRENKNYFHQKEHGQFK